MLKLRLACRLFLLPSIVLGQIAKLEDPKLKIDYWLRNYTQETRPNKCEMAEKVFANLLTVADKPIGVLPKLYIFSNLEFRKLFALPDGSIILPSNVIDFCVRNRKDAPARLAFLLGHELKHIVRDDYWIQRIFEFAPGKGKKPDNNEMQKLWENVEWDISQQVRRTKETEADEYGQLYASLAGYDIRSNLSPSNSFISDY